MFGVVMCGPSLFFVLRTPSDSARICRSEKADIFIISWLAFEGKKETTWCANGGKERYIFRSSWRVYCRKGIEWSDSRDEFALIIWFVVAVFRTIVSCGNDAFLLRRGKQTKMSLWNWLCAWNNRLQLILLMRKRYRSKETFLTDPHANYLIESISAQ